MSYALGTKLIPGQINFQTTRTGRLPSLQPLIEAGLPYAPYIEHGSWTTGRPDIARYGRDPYRGISGWQEDAEHAMTETPGYFMAWYTAKSLAIVVAVGVAAYCIGRSRR
jgi:hypothetical protein